MEFSNKSNLNPGHQVCQRGLIGRSAGTSSLQDLALEGDSNCTISAPLLHRFFFAPVQFCRQRAWTRLRPPATPPTTVAQPRPSIPALFSKNAHHGPYTDRCRFSKTMFAKAPLDLLPAESAAGATRVSAWVRYLRRGTSLAFATWTRISSLYSKRPVNDGDKCPDSKGRRACSCQDAQGRAGG